MLETIAISDSRSGATAKVLPGVGFNCYSFVAAPAGQLIEMLWSAPEFASGGGRPNRSGIPILFPFAGRIRGTSFDYGGRSYALEVGDDFGNAIHGFVLSRPWRITDRGESHVRGEFQASIDEPRLLERWPADFRIAVTYRVASDELTCEVTVMAAGKQPLPFWLGLHPYFRLPLGGVSAEDCKIQAQVTSTWELEQLLPTGRVVPAAIAGRLAESLPLGGEKLDDVFTGLAAAGGTSQASIEDPTSGRRLTITFDASFKNLVIFNPPHREAICIEPYTAVPNAIELEQKGIAAGLTILPPGAEATYTVRIRLT